MALPPGPRYPGAIQLAEWALRPLPLLERCAERYGDVFMLDFGALGRLTMVSSPAHIKQIFTAPTDVLEAGRGNALLGPLVGPFSVLLLDGAGHLEQRRLLLPPLHGERMQAYCHTMRQLTDADLDQWPLHRPIMLLERTQQITLEVILRTVFGVDDAGELADLRRALIALLDVAGSPLIFFPLFHWDLGRWSPWGRVAERLREADTLIYRLVRRRRADPRLAERDDILALLLQARHEDGEPMSDRELRDELITLLAAGHETTAMTLAWTVERILNHPDVLTKLTDELARVVGAGPVQPEQVARLDYLDAVVKETLRQRPIIPIVSRMVSRPFSVDGFELPLGTVVSPCIALTHQRADLYPEPTAFRPERFLGQKIDPYAWLPFGGGSRRCLGMAFSMYEMKVILATLFSRARLALVMPRTHAPMRRGISLAPEGGAPIRLVSRRAVARS